MPTSPVAPSARRTRPAGRHTCTGPAPPSSPAATCCCGRAGGREPFPTQGLFSPRWAHCGFSSRPVPKVSSPGDPTTPWTSTVVYLSSAPAVGPPAGARLPVPSGPSGIAWSVEDEWWTRGHLHEHFRVLGARALEVVFGPHALGDRVDQGGMPPPSPACGPAADTVDVVPHLQYPGRLTVLSPGLTQPIGADCPLMDRPPPSAPSPPRPTWAWSLAVRLSLGRRSLRASVSPPVERGAVPDRGPRGHMPARPGS